MKCFEYDNPAFKIKVLDYTYTSEPSINTALPLRTSRIKTVMFYLGVLLTFGFLWLLSKWSAKRKAIFRYSICSLDHATHFLIHDQDTEGQETLVERDNKWEVRFKRNCISFSYHDRTYIYIEQKEVFVPIRYEELGLHLDKLRKDKFVPYSEQKREEILQYYGENVMRLPVQNQLDIFIQQMLTPYQVFQTYGIMLWIYEEYYIFAFILLSYSLYTYWSNSRDMSQNQEKLAFQSYFDVQTKVLINEGPPTQEQEHKEVQLCTNLSKLDQHRSQLMRDNFNGIQSIQPEVELPTRTRSQKRQSRQVRNEENVLINNRNVRFQRISSHKLIPGDIIILNEGDIVPCDCILLRGEALVNEKYSTGENYMVRKQEIENFTYVKENQRSFLIYLGTEIVKIKNNQYKLKRKIDNDLDSIQSSMREEKIDAVNEIVCLVTQTNFNTLRGKFLRAIRYQAKQEESFFRQTIYFIYIIIFLCTIVYFVYLGVIGPYTHELKMFLIYIDLLITAIPPTLPTVLNVGIDFVLRRLKAHGITCILPKSVLTAGKVDTLVLKGQQVFGKQFQVHSAAIGTKTQRGFGLTFSSVNQFESYNESEGISFIDDEDLRKKKIERSQFHRLGSLFIDSLACCHTLQFFRKSVEGSIFQKKVFEFAQASNLSEDNFKTLHNLITVQKIIRFPRKDMKLGVLATLRPISLHQQQNHHEDEQFFQNKPNRNQSQGKRVIFIKGSAQKVLASCLMDSYPADAFEYIVDMAQKGFIVYSYAMQEVDKQWLGQGRQLLDLASRHQFIFLGFIILQQIKSEDNQAAMKALNEAKIKIIYLSEERELETTSRAIFNGICDKNELLLCNISRTKDKIYCKGHIQWQSSSSTQYISEFLTQFEDFGRNSKVSISSHLYEQIFMKKDIPAAEGLFKRSVIYNKMELKQEKNLYVQLERRHKVSCAVGSSGNLSECANLSLELERSQSALLSSFYTGSSSLGAIVTCLRICRAGLSTNFHGFSMMILFSLMQFTTVAILNCNYETLTDDQMLYQDLFITFPIFITINLTQPASKLSKQLPPSSFFSLRQVISMSGQLVIQFLAQLGFILYVLSLNHFSDLKGISLDYYKQHGDFRAGSQLSLALFVLSNNLYLGIVLSTSVSKPFRKPFYTNPFYTLNMLLLWCYNTFLVLFPRLSPSEMRAKNLGEQSQFILVLALVVGNLVMVVMYLFENLIVFLWSQENPCIRAQPELALNNEAP